MNSPKSALIGNDYAHFTGKDAEIQNGSFSHYGWQGLVSPSHQGVAPGQRFITWILGT